VGSPRRHRDRFQSLAVRVGLHGPCIVLRLSGELSSATVPALQRHLDQAIAFRRPPWVIVDLSSVSGVDDTGLGLLTQAREQVGSRSGRLILVGLRDPQPPHFQVRRSLEEALAELVDEGVARFRT
jgi:stage II sporulation protein AA (anti-sigma F factor antagonist)